MDRQGCRWAQIRRRSVENDLSRQQRKSVKGRLEARFNELREIVREELLRSDNEHFLDLAGRVHDPEEQSVANLLVDIDLAIIDQHVREIGEVERALMRLSAGTYGRCVECGHEIESARLKAYPSISRCMICQSRRERDYAQPTRAKL